MNYFVTRDRKEYGPYSLADLQRYVAEGRILLRDLARSEQMQELVRVSQIINEARLLRDVCKRYSGCSKGYFLEPIPASKANNARTSLKIPPAEEIVALIDLTLLGGTKEAVVVTDGGLYWKNAGEVPQSLTLEQLRHRAPREHHGLQGKSIDFGDGLKMNLVGSGALVVMNNHVMLQLLNELKAMKESAALASAESNGSGIGLVECEFCRNKNKPEVTYCKRCGIKLRG